MYNKKYVRQYIFLGLIMIGSILSFLPPLKGATKQIYKISIETVLEEGVTDGMIDRGLVPYVERVLKEAEWADAVILEINTHGGRVDSAVKILDDVRNANVRTIAFIQRAISAGALVALATDDIVMTPGATIGAATPIEAAPGGEAQPVTEKYTSYVRAEFRGAASSKNRRPDIAEAMVDASLSIQDPAFQLTADALEAFGEELDTELERDEELEADAREDIRRTILDDLENLEGEKFADKSEFLDAVEAQIGAEYLRDYKDLILKHAKSWIAAEGKLLTLTTDEALEPGIRIADYAAGNLKEVLQTVATSIVLTNHSFRELETVGVPVVVTSQLRDLEDEIFTRKTQFLNAVEERIKLSQFAKYQALIWKYAEKEFGFADVSPAEIVTIELNWAEQLVRFLTSPVISGLLMTFGFLGLFFEFRTPGFGVFGTIGVVCLGLFFWGHFLVKLAGWEELLVFVIGLILLAIEIFVIPGFGIVGILGIVAILASLMLATMGQWELITLPDISSALTRITIALVFSIIATIVLARYLVRTPFGQHLILSDSQEQEEGYVAQIHDQSSLLGLTGTTLTPIHPSGTVEIQDKRYDVVSEGEFIDKHVTIKVIDVEGVRIVVRQIDET